MTRLRIAAALLAAALAAVVLARRRAPAPTPAAADDERPADERTWRCDCGREYVVTGVDRHRVYRPAGDPPGEPLLEPHCTGCGAPLPATREMAEAPQA